MLTVVVEVLVVVGTVVVVSTVVCNANVSICQSDEARVAYSRRRRTEGRRRCCRCRYRGLASKC